jgi:hypothetical protein
MYLLEDISPTDWLTDRLMPLVVMMKPEAMP